MLARKKGSSRHVSTKFVVCESVGSVLHLNYRAYSWTAIFLFQDADTSTSPEESEPESTSNSEGTNESSDTSDSSSSNDSDESQEEEETSSGSEGSAESGGQESSRHFVSPGRYVKKIPLDHEGAIKCSP